MSAPTPTRPKQRQGDPNRELMKVLGGANYTAMPPDQHEWQKADAEHNPPLHRLWSWMVHNTLTWGHTTVDGEAKAYATSKDGAELHLEHAANDLQMDPANARRAWRDGVAMGLWRRGTAQEGKRKLFLCGKVAPPKVVPEDDEKVCTDLFHPCLQKLPPYVRDQIVSRPAEEVKRIIHWYSRYTEVERLSLADVMAAGRLVVGRLADEGWRSLGIEVRRLEPETDEERQARLSSLLPQIEQLVNTVAAKISAPADPDLEAQLAVDSAPSRAQRSVQTHNGSVQSSKFAVYKENSSGVQTESRSASLLPVATTSRGQQAGSSGIRGRRANPGPSPIHEGRAAVQVHAGESRFLSELTTEERAGAEKLLQSIRDVQRKHSRKWVGEAANPEDRGQLTTAARMVRTVGLEELDEFICHIEAKTVERSLGHQLTIGLVSGFAADFRAGVAERAQKRKAEADRRAKSEAFQRQVDENARRENELIERTEREWDALPLVEKMDRLKAAGEELKRNPREAARLRHNTEERARTTELRAKRKLRDEIEKAGVR